MKKKQEIFQVEVPETYGRLALLAAKGKGMRKDACSCGDSHFHLGRGGKVVLGFFAGSFALWVGSFVCIFVDTGHRSLFSLSTGILFFVFCALMRATFHLSDRGWVKKHPDKVVTELIPTYLYTQINYMEDALLGNGSRFELVRSEIRKVVEKGYETEVFVRQFSSVLPENKEMPPFLLEKAKEGEYCLRFAETDNLLTSSALLLRKDFGNKREEVNLFQKSKLQNYSFAEEICLAQTQAICKNLNILSTRFNRCLDESHVSELCSATKLSENPWDYEKISKGYANDLLKRLTNLYGIKPDESKEESAKPGHNKDGEPFVEDGKLTEAGVAELTDLERGLDQ